MRSLYRSMHKFNTKARLMLVYKEKNNEVCIILGQVFMDCWIRALCGIVSCSLILNNWKWKEFGNNIPSINLERGKTMLLHDVFTFCQFWTVYSLCVKIEIQAYISYCWRNRTIVKCREVMSGHIYYNSSHCNLLEILTLC